MPIVYSEFTHEQTFAETMRSMSLSQIFFKQAYVTFVLMSGVLFLGFPWKTRDRINHSVLRRRSGDPILKDENGALLKDQRTITPPGPILERVE